MTTFREQLKGRFAVLGAVIVLVLSVLAVRLWTMQVLSGESFATQADDNRIREIPVDAARGRILDRKGRPLVTNRAARAVVVAPAALEDRDLLAKLSGLLGMPVSEIEERLRSSKAGPLKPRVVKIDVPMTVIAYLAEHQAQFPGVHTETIAVRSYPYKQLGAHVLGYTGEVSDAQLEEKDFEGYSLGDLVGKTGAERQFETVLQGEKGYQRLEVDARGRQRRLLNRREPIPGRDVRLTLDIDAQRIAEQALSDAIAEAHSQKFYKSRAGAAVALDVRTGEVLAMASAPTFDPESFLGGVSKATWARLNQKSSEYPLNNRVVMSAYPPASTYKVVTGLAGLSYGITSEWHTYHCDGRWTEMGEQWSKWCWRKSGHGTVSFNRGIVQSCDTVFYEIGYEFYKRKKEEFQAFSRSFGLGSKTGIDLPGEVKGRVPDAAWKKRLNRFYPEYRTWLPGDTVNMAIGQGDLLTSPLQMATVYAGVANGGKVMRPHVLGAVLGPEGEVVLRAKPEVAHTVKADAGDIAVVRRALLDVTQEGTARGAFVNFPEEVAGKTGTAQVKGKDDYAWFVAYAPADEPRYAVAVLVEQGGHGGSVAAPAARQILAQLLGLPVTKVHATDDSR